MAESEATEQTSQVTQTTDESATKGFTPEDFNRAFSAREKTMMAKIEKLLASKESPQTPEKTPESSDKDKDLGLSTLQRKVRELEKINQESIKRAQQAELRSSVSKLIRDKVSSDWQDVAEERILSRVQYEDSRAYIAFDDVPYPLEEGVQKWLSHADNKRFLPAPKTARNLGPDASAQEIKHLLNKPNLSKSERQAISDVEWSQAFEKFNKS